jgi:hypothetical protein
MSAVSKFAEGVNIILSALREPFLNDVGIGSTIHNERARMLRNGIAIIIFSNLEEFFKGRAKEHFAELNKSSLPYTHMPDALRELITMKAAGGVLQSQRRNKDISDRVAQFDRFATDLAQTYAIPPKFSNFGFGYNSSNISFSDIVNLLSCFQVDKSTKKMISISSRYGSPLIVPDREFDLLSKARHQAAHEFFSQIPITDLQRNAELSISFAISIDLIMSKTVYEFQRKKKKNVSLGAHRDVIINAIDLDVPKIRFLDEDSDGKWLEYVEGGRVSKRHIDMISARQSAKERAANRGQALVVRNRIRKPIWWWYHY